MTPFMKVPVAEAWKARFDEEKNDCTIVDEARDTEQIEAKQDTPAGRARRSPPSPTATSPRSTSPLLSIYIRTVMGTCMGTPPPGSPAAPQP